ncbi:MAG: pentapeptide repeat-containing protein [Gammaproteobacteria bacterium]|nr:pentapeptide repeat-containing protein [Gammaproteobacteria bacterium]
MNLEKKDEYWSEIFNNIDFSGANISEKEFDGCTFNHCNFSDALFNRCNFVDCAFISCNLSLVNLKYSKFTDVSFRESKLIGIDWTKADWPRVIFSAPIKFYKSILNDSSFYALPLQELVLEECKAHDVDFREGDFSNATFTYTDFTGSFFANTNLSSADFTEASDYDIDIFRNDIKHAKFSRFEAIRLLDSLEVELID